MTTVKESKPSNQDRTYGLTKLDSMIQIFCLLQGPTLFLFPRFLVDVGIVLGICSTLVLGLFYLYLVNLYFWCEKELRQFNPSIESVTLYSLVEEVFVNFAKMPRLGKSLRAYLKYEIVVSWCLGISLALIFVCENVQLIFRYFNYPASYQAVLLYISLPLLVMCLLPNLTFLKNISYYLCAIILLIMAELLIYVIFTDTQPWAGSILFGPIQAVPTYLNNLMFTICLSPLLFLYKREMICEKDYTSLFGSLNMVLVVSLVCSTSFAIICGLHFGPHTRVNIIENLPENAFVVVSIVAMVITMVLAGMIVFYSIFQALWENSFDAKVEHSKNLNVYVYAVKLGMFVFILLAALLIPTLKIILNFLSSFSTPYDVFIVPALLETVVVWNRPGNKNKPRKFFILFKNAFIITLAVVIGVASLLMSVEEMWEYISGSSDDGQG